MAQSNSDKTPDQSENLQKLEKFYKDLAQQEWTESLKTLPAIEMQLVADALLKTLQSEDPETRAANLIVDEAIILVEELLAEAIANQSPVLYDNPYFPDVQPNLPSIPCLPEIKLLSAKLFENQANWLEEYLMEHAFE
ncbi:MAG: hypothetical protein AAGD25_20405 [Cyanobacteria bacterium P01_F01_bin.150]